MSPSRATTARSSTNDEPGPHRSVALCRHESPTAPPHVDLFLGPEKTEFGDEEAVLSSWRLTSDPRDGPEGVWIEATATPPHRGLYARLSGPRSLDGNRGLVTPLASGRARVRAVGRSLFLDVEWSGDVRERYELRIGDEPNRLRRIPR